MLLIELGERLSEFSYGYGVTRAVEKCLESVGIKTTPFLPSLIHEKEIGFDVGFNKPGAVLMLQFKLGQSLERFMRSDLTKPAPPLAKPFWRFKIDTAEPDGQYETLLKAEMDGAEVYYVAPKFSDWTEYASAFQSDLVLETSLLISPADIRKQLLANGIADGLHRVVYDGARVYVCSEPIALPKRDKEAMINSVRDAIFERKRPLSDVISTIYHGFENRASVRRAIDRPDYQRELIETVQASLQKPVTRSDRLANFASRSRTPNDAMAAALGLEVWSLGMQLILVTAD